MHRVRPAMPAKFLEVDFLFDFLLILAAPIGGFLALAADEFYEAILRHMKNCERSRLYAICIAGSTPTMISFEKGRRHFRLCALPLSQGPNDSIPESILHPFSYHNSADIPKLNMREKEQTSPHY